ncbi:MAG: efflux RND transporter permease subunit [Roseiarcus sp.]|uniref:efflux RND transporter permease subunit n=1 Tax=Roseiarcus sp. TaxID=1969460 RepID=UPI003BAF43BB
MNPSEIFILRPVATTLLMVAILLAGMFAYNFLPLSALPEVDYPTIQVQTFYPGASPEVMTSAVTAPLERQFGQMPGLNQMTSASSGGASVITLQFNLDLSLDIAEQEVQAAINAAGNLLPQDLPVPPVYAKVNPADAPIMTLAVTSKSLPLIEIEDLVETRLAQKLSQQPGVGLVSISGGQRPAIRIQFNPGALAAYGLNIDDLRTTLNNNNTNTPKGAFDGPQQSSTINANDQINDAAKFADVIVAYRNGNPVRVSDVASVLHGPENRKIAAWANSTRAIILNIQRQPGANVIQVVDTIKRLLPKLRASLPVALDVTVLSDRTTTIRASVEDVEFELGLAVILVVLVIFVFLRNLPATIIPSLSVPLSLVGTLVVMYLLKFSLDNLSLMALTISTGFVVDDAIVVLENISRYLEEGMPRIEAAIKGANEVGFTVLSISLSLIAVFAPLIFFGGIVGRLFNEFALTLSVAVMISLVVSLTTTPMMCALILPREKVTRHGRLYRASEYVFDAALNFYRTTLRMALRHPGVVMLSLLATIGLNYYMFRYQMTYGLFPVQDTGLIIGSIQADQSISFQSMQKKLLQLQTIVQDDPAVASVVGFTGGRQTNSGFVYVSLKPFSERKISADDVVTRLRAKLAEVAGARLFMVAVSDLRTGGRQSNATYQYTLLSDNTAELYTWAPKLTAALMNSDVLKDVNSDQQQGGLETDITIDRDTAMRLGLTLNAVDNTLYDAFGQRQVSTIYNAQNQYHVVMEVAPRYWQDPRTLDQLYVSTSGANPTGVQQTGIPAGDFASSTGAASTAATIAADSARNLATNALAASGHSTASAGAAVSTSLETMVPLSAFARFAPGHTPLSVNHQGPFAASTISFNLASGHALSEAKTEIENAIQRIGMPSTVRGAFAGTAATYQQSQSNMPLLFGAALVTIYIVLGILYESLIHPITILSTLFSASVGAALALWVFDTQFTIIAAIGVLLLIGIVKKNAIMMVDFALEAERQGLDTREAIESACVLRFRPIMMTTCAALFGALPLAFGTGEGSELRHPLGITIVGGLIVSQVLTLYTTPVVFIYLDSFGKWLGRLWNRYYVRVNPTPLARAQ